MVTDWQPIRNHSNISQFFLIFLWNFHETVRSENNKKVAHWEAQFRDNSGDIPTRGSGNYSSDEQKEIAHFKRELRNAQAALYNDYCIKAPNPFI